MKFTQEYGTFVKVNSSSGSSKFQNDEYIHADPSHNRSKKKEPPQSSVGKRQSDSKAFDSMMS